MAHVQLTNQSLLRQAMVEIASLPDDIWQSYWMLSNF